MSLVQGVKDAVVVAGYRVGWRVVRALPERPAYAMFDLIADLITRRRGRGVRRLRANYAKVRPDLDDVALDRLVRDGMRSYLRYYCDAFRLPDRSVDELAAGVHVSGDGPIRELLAAGTGVVVFIGHMGGWDTAGAWSTTQLAPVTTVVERLEPEAVFTTFLGFRERLGMTILPLTGGPNPFTGMREALERGEFVALAADRDLTASGVEVDFCGHRARMAKGPALLSAVTGAALFAAAITYQDAPEGEGIAGKMCHVDFSAPILPRVEGSTDAVVADLTQQCADYVGTAVQAYPSEWHMLQRVFVEDLDPARLARAVEPR
ncbi:MAG TPA: phosphatidylinositol mannoside acyltransferase [Candidatus Lustribacter sp.]|nr:phosphatidylinositol mannoside acyltransferase [Candidatus Lustribacter sp.]